MKQIILWLTLTLAVAGSLQAQRYPEDYVKSGIMAARLGDTDKALEHFNRAVVLDPKLPEAYYNRGLLLLQLKEYTRALDDFTPSG